MTCVKVKFTQEQATKAQRRSKGNLGARWRWVVNATPRPLDPRERPGTHYIRGWVGFRAGLDGCGKSRSPPGFDPQTIQPVASSYTDYGIAAPCYMCIL
jgi:hypothetical protein